MSWLVVGASEIGTSHLRHAKPCQDSCWFQGDAGSRFDPHLAVFVADGAGSASLSLKGAETAIEVAVDLLCKALDSGVSVVSSYFAETCLFAVRDALQVLALDSQHDLRDYACTFLGLVSSAAGTLAFQIGDGGIVVDTGKGLELSIAPMAGEYANMTRFVTDFDAASVLMTKCYPSPASFAAVFTDGIQKIATNMATNTPHTPFFEPFFRIMSRSKAEDEDALNAALVSFLKTPAVDQRTDDDKTLVLATRVTK